MADPAGAVTVLDQPDHCAPWARELLARHGLDSFEALWRLDTPWFEEPNRRRGGWSGVVRIALEDASGQVQGLFVKRQEDHPRRDLLHPFGEPTFAAELRNLLRTAAAGVPTLEPVWYQQRRVEGHLRAILITRELVGYRPLQRIAEEWATQGRAGSLARRALIQVAGPAIRRLHDHRLVHNALHPKHIFVRLGGDLPELCLIDLEKMRRTLTPRRAMLRDLDSLNRRARHFSRSERLRFLLAYLGTPRLDAEGRRIWRRLAARFRRPQG